MGGTFWRYDAREMEADSLNQQAGTTSDDEGQTIAKKGTPWGWRLEILSIIGSVGWMVGVIAILGTMQDKEHSRWKFFLSLNATLAIFATAAKLTAAIAVSACISQYKWIHFKKGPQRLVDLDLFDSASRGPLGSLILLCRRPKGLASIGAFVTILALALDVFVQQVVKLDEGVVRQFDGRARLGIVHNWNGSSTLPGAGIVTVADAFRVTNAESDIKMQGAVYRGVFKLQNPPVFNCSASTCVWDEPVVSLGFKSTCADVTEQSFRTVNASRFGTYNAGGANITTPGGIVLPAVYVPTDSQTVVSVGAKSLLNSELININLTYVDPDIARIAVFRTKVDRKDFLIFLNQSEVIECHLGLVAYRWTNTTASRTNLTSLSEELIPLQRGVAQEDARVPLRPGGTFRIYDAVEFSQEGLPVLRASIADLRALTLLLNSTRFAGSISHGISIRANTLPSGMGDAFRTDNITDIFENMAKSMTDQLRSNWSMVAEGVSIDKAFFVHVQWEWLTLPLFVEVISIVFVIIVLVKCMKAKDVQLWKSSAVAILTHGLSFQEGNEVVGTLGPNVKTVNELETISKTVKAKLG
ncbi:hypothetical protein QBC43DRAFT_327065 [Cladorrhinum sp. PSN259]|nr:hypothetical protein QBC43DRAFT_327065 [Cladorrhinum sp. PSN259]